MAGNARFHDKLHRKNHHTNPTVGFADSASDPIASPSEPFQGDFVINGKLSSSSGIQVLSANFEKDVYCNNIHVSSVTYTNWISGNSTETIISDGALTGHGNNTLTLDYGKAIYNKVNNNTIMYMNSSNVGIGTTNPISKLHVDGDITVSNGRYLNLDTNTGGGFTAIKRNTIQNGMEFFTQSASRMFISDTNGNVGIGTTTPTEKLHVDGNVLITGNLSALGGTTQIDTTIVTTSAMIIDTLGTTNALRVTQRGTGNAILVEDDTNPDSSAFVVNSAGNVGIGTTTPNSTLHVNGDITLPGKTLLGSITGSTNGAVGIAGGNTFLNGSGGAIAVRGLTNTFNGGGIEFYYGNGTSTIEAMRIVSGGKVGIGTDIPSGTLDVTANTTGAALFISQQNIDGYAILIQDNGGPNKPFVVKNRGFVGIGTPSPNKELTVAGDISATGLIYSKDIYLNRGDTQREGGQINFARSFDNTTVFAIDTYTDNIGSLSSRLRFIDVSSNAERMTMLSSGNVGIGTANPISKLHVDGDIRIKNGNHLFLADVDNGTRIRRDIGNNGIALETASATRLFVADNGNVGIGTLTPTDTLHVSGGFTVTNNASSVSYFAYDSGIKGPSLQMTGVSGAYIDLASTNVGGGAGSLTDYTLRIATNGVSNNSVVSACNYINSNQKDFHLMTNDITRVAITSGGNVGIGTTNPISKLHVDGDITLENGRYLNLDTNTGGGATAIRRNTVQNGMEFFTQSAPRMFISDTNGNVGIGTLYPTSKLHLSGNTGTVVNIETDSSSQETSIDFICNSTGGRQYRVGTGGSAGGFQNGTFGFYDVTSSVTRMAITSGGDVYINNLAGVGNRAVYSDASGLLTNTASDGTLKESVSGITQGLDEVLQLNPISFNWKNTEKYGSQREIGFIAQEVQPIIPEVIGENANGTLSLDYSKMISVLTKAIQELNDKVEAQATEITSLKAKIK